MLCLLLLVVSTMARSDSKIVKIPSVDIYEKVEFSKVSFEDQKPLFGMEPTAVACAFTFSETLRSGNLFGGFYTDGSRCRFLQSFGSKFTNKVSLFRI